MATKIPTDLCLYMQFEQFQHAERQFDGGEFSAAKQSANPHAPCGTCTWCVESAAAAQDGPPWLVDQFGDEIVGEDESPVGAYGGSADAPAPHTDRGEEPAWVAMAAALHRELRAARIGYDTDYSQAGNWTVIVLANGSAVQVWYQDLGTGADEYVVIVQPAGDQDAVHVANFQPAYATTVAQLIALFVRAGGVV